MNPNQDIQPVTSVFQDPESYESMTNALAMLKLMVQGEADIQNGRHHDEKKVFDRIRARIEARRDNRP